MERFDLCVIGGGPSGYAAVVRALDFGKKVILVEKAQLGGAGIWDGALSSKTLWELAKDIQKLYETNRGYEVKEVVVTYQTLIRHMNDAVNERMQQLRFQLDYFQQNLPDGQFRYIEGFGSFVDKNTINIAKPDGTNIQVHADHIILATGSRPRKIPGIPIDEKNIVTSDGITSFPNFPESLVILGAGVIGCEFATIFASLGKTKVYLISKDQRILPFEDEDIAEVVADNLRSLGVTIHTGAALENMTYENNQVKYVLKYKDGRTETHFVEKALISVGRVNNLEHLNAREVGLEFNERGALVVVDSQTNVPNIYAVGDLTADICLVNVGEVEGRHAVERIFNNKTEPLQYDNISTIMFLYPEVAAVGMNEIEAQRAGISYRVAKYSYDFIGRAIAMRNTNGFFKILVTDDDEMRILGMRALGAHASSTIQGVALLISLRMGIRAISELIHPHPSITEGIQDCVRMFLGNSIFKPSVFNKLSCYRVVDGQKTEIEI